MNKFSGPSIKDGERKSPPECDIQEDIANDHFPGTPKRPTHEVQIEAQQINKRRQDKQAKDFVKRHKGATKGNGVGVGAVVTIRNDYRAISHPLGAVGVVFEAKETGGIQVCTEWGVIVQGGKQK